jgi:hypothetical protein
MKTNQLIDHIDRNGLNNRKNNLRLSNKSLNACNSIKRSNCSSKYKGVSYKKDRKKWEAYINFQQRRVRLGYFKSEIDAAKAYNQKAKELHKEHSLLNEIKDL